MKKRVIKSLVYGSETYQRFLTEVEHSNTVLNDLEKKAIFEYTGWFYKQYYSFLNNDEPLSKPSPIIQEGLPFLDAALQKSSRNHNMILFHGLPKKLHAKYDYLKHIQLDADEHVFIRKSFMSTSVDPKVASNNTGSVAHSIVFEIHSNDGIALGSETSEMGISEKEILLPRGKNFKVTAVEHDVEFVWGPTRNVHTVVRLEDQYV